MTGPGSGAGPGPAYAASEEPVHAWERWVIAWHAVFYVVLGLATALALADATASGGRRAASAVLSALLGGWYWAWVVRRRVWARPMAQVLAYLGGAAALWAVLVVLHPAYLLVAFSAYQQVISYLPTRRAAVVGVVVLSGLLSSLPLLEGRAPSPKTLAIAALATGVGILSLLWVDAIIRQSEDRHRLIAELQATRAELARAERQAGTLAERERLAREIHDSLAQGVTSVAMLLEAAAADLGPAPAVARGHVDAALATARDTLADARRFVWALQPEALERGSLADALSRVADTLARETGMAARLQVTGAPEPLPPPAEIALLRVAQEGTANIRKHAGAREAVLTLSYLDDRVILDVRDDGRGFDPASARTRAPTVGGGTGLRGLEARLALLGGGLAVESTIGEGTVVVAQVPIETRPAAGPG